VIRGLGVRYRIKELYYKPFACCRWVHPALEGVKEILESHAISHREIDRVIVHTFREAAALSRKPPRCTEEAQYNLAFPIAAFFWCSVVWVLWRFWRDWRIRRSAG
jgi:2-methylcitrate dehydratase PrpD